jgi:hypothetical protein
MPCRGTSCYWPRMARPRRNCDRKCCLRCKARQASRTNDTLTGMTHSWLPASWNPHGCAQSCVSIHMCMGMTRFTNVPLAAFSNPESAPEDLYVDGYLIPANVCNLPSLKSRGHSADIIQTNVIVDAQAINIDNPYWVNGTQYNPRRFFSLNKSDVWSPSAVSSFNLTDVAGPP